ncbi:MAG: hypothetical protein HRT45_04315 [Bdellovibrionales bacterium]|nr:hypothetical protein [Bdellovibrionales bacterium]
MKKQYTDLKPEEVDYIVIKNTDAGPFFEDVFFLIFAKEQSWQIPFSGSGEFLRRVKTFPHVNMENFIKSMTCTENRLFVLYRGLDQPVLSEGRVEELRVRLDAFLMSQFSVPAAERIEIVEKLFAKYSQEGREYHNLEHLLNCLWELDRLEDTIVNKDRLELAIWYHDYVYSPKSYGNEKKSAEAMLNDLSKYPGRIDLQDVKALIVADAKNEDLSYDQQVFLDIDHSALGQGVFEYQAYQQSVYEEYRLVPSWVFKFKRKAVLTRLLARGVFHTSVFRAKYQEQAVENIKRELSHWSFRFLPVLFS